MNRKKEEEEEEREEGEIERKRQKRKRDRERINDLLPRKENRGIHESSVPRVEIRDQMPFIMSILLC